MRTTQTKDTPLRASLFGGCRAEACYLEECSVTTNSCELTSPKGYASNCSELSFSRKEDMSADRMDSQSSYSAFTFKAPSVNEFEEAFYFYLRPEQSTAQTLANDSAKSSNSCAAREGSVPAGHVDL